VYARYLRRNQVWEKKKKLQAITEDPTKQELLHGKLIDDELF
jgi:hypothetical protein